MWEVWKFGGSSLCNSASILAIGREILFQQRDLPDVSAKVDSGRPAARHRTPAVALEEREEIGSRTSAHCLLPRCATTEEADSCNDSIMMPAADSGAGAQGGVDAPHLVVVVSAMGGTTNLLAEAIQAAIDSARRPRMYGKDRRSQALDVRESQTKRRAFMLEVDSLAASFVGICGTSDNPRSLAGHENLRRLPTNLFWGPPLICAVRMQLKCLEEIREVSFRVLHNLSDETRHRLGVEFREVASHIWETANASAAVLHTVALTGEASHGTKPTVMGAGEVWSYRIVALALRVLNLASLESYSGEHYPTIHLRHADARDFLTMTTNHVQESEYEHMAAPWNYNRTLDDRDACEATTGENRRPLRLSTEDRGPIGRLAPLFPLRPKIHGEGQPVWGIERHSCNEFPVFDWNQSFNLLWDWWCRAASLETGFEKKIARPRLVVVVPGFVCRTSAGGKAVLQRNGSDVSGAAMAVLFSATRLVVWSDVPGMFSGDPRLLEATRHVEVLSYEEAQELASLGAKVLHPATLVPCRIAQIPIWLRSSKDPNHIGTHISSHRDCLGVGKVVTLLKDVCLLTLMNIPEVLFGKFAAKFFQALAAGSCDPLLVALTTQTAISAAVAGVKRHEVVKYLCGAFTDCKVQRSSPARLGPAPEQRYTDSSPKLNVVADCAIVAVVGSGMGGRPGTLGAFCAALGRAHVNIRAVSQSDLELSISFVVDQGQSLTALKALHRVVTDGD